VDTHDPEACVTAARQGWIVVAGGFVIMFVTFGVAYSFSLFFSTTE
jgi:hypothetical protein